MTCARSVMMILIAVVTAAYGQDSVVKWGAAENSLQLGVSETTLNDATGHPMLSVSLKNAGREARDLSIPGPIDNLKITAAAGGGQSDERVIVDVRELTLDRVQDASTGSGGTKLRLEPGETHVLSIIPMQMLVCFLCDGHEVPLETLLRKGYTARISLNVSSVTLFTSFATP